MKKIFSILALLLMAVSGAWAQTERLLTTITPTGQTTYSETTPGAVTVTQNCEYYNSGYGWCFEFMPGSVTVEANEGYTISKCVFTLSNGSTTILTISTPPFKINFVYDDEIGGCYCEGTDKYDIYFGVKSIQVYTNTVDVTANEGATGEYWATYYNGTESYTADANTTVFQAALSGSSLTLREVPNREIPATKAVILKSSSSSITLTPATTTATLEGNQLVGTATAITNPGNAYVLNKGTNGVGFYKLSSTGTIGANKAYLTYSGPSTLARSFFGFDETTGIEMPTAEVIDADAVVYDLQGRRVAQPTKGLYIVNGKKVIIK